MSVPIISPGDPIRRNNKFVKEWVENDSSTSTNLSEKDRCRIHAIRKRYRASSRRGKFKETVIQEAKGVSRERCVSSRAYRGKKRDGKIRCGIVPTRSWRFQIYVLAYIGNGRQRLDVHRFHIGRIVLFPFIDLSSIRSRKPTAYTNTASASPQKNLWNNKMQT